MFNAATLHQIWRYKICELAVNLLISNFFVILCYQAYRPLSRASSSSSILPDLNSPIKIDNTATVSQQNRSASLERFQKLDNTAFDTDSSNASTSKHIHLTAQSMPNKFGGLRYRFLVKYHGKIF